MKKVEWKVLAISFVIVAIAAFAGSIFTSRNVKSSWYASIKPSITPPNYVFPIAWSVLFILIALSLYFVWVSSKKDQKKQIAWAFGANLGFNILWSALFFGIRDTKSAFVEMIILWFTILGMLAIAWRISRKAFWMLLPYIIWVSFAAVLNFMSAF